MKISLLKDKNKINIFWDNMIGKSDNPLQTNMSLIQMLVNLYNRLGIYQNFVKVVYFSRFYSREYL